MEESNCVKNRLKISKGCRNHTIHLKRLKETKKRQQRGTYNTKTFSYSVLGRETDSYLDRNPIAKETLVNASSSEGDSEDEGNISVEILILIIDKPKL